MRLLCAVASDDKVVDVLPQVGRINLGVCTIMLGLMAWKSNRLAVRRAPRIILSVVNVNAPSVRTLLVCGCHFSWLQDNMHLLSFLYPECIYCWLR